VKKSVFDNLPLKIAAVLLSLVLWLYVTSRGQSEISLDVPVEFASIPRGLEIVNHSVRTVTINVKGQERLIKNLRTSDIRVSVDMEKAKAGDMFYPIRTDDILLPSSLVVSSVNPSSVRIRMEETAQKTVRVFPVIAGEPHSRYYVKTIVVKPPVVTVEGIRSEVMKVKSMRTELVDITGFSETFTQDVRLDLGGRNVRLKKTEVSVEVVIAEKKR
jgi:YbbR domain-containing protein